MSETPDRISLNSNSDANPTVSHKSKHPLFYINKNNLPMSTETLQKMLNFCKDRTSSHPEIHAEILSIIEKSSNLSKNFDEKCSVQSLKAPVWLDSGMDGTVSLNFLASAQQQAGSHANSGSGAGSGSHFFEPTNHNTASSLINPIISSHDLIYFVDKVQNYMKSLKYNFTGMQFYDINKTRSIRSLMEIAKNMIKYSLPIKCLEAVILGIHLTNPCPNNLVRFTLSFKSACKKTKSKHYHVLLGLYIKSVGYGCIGMSRKDELAYKKLGQFESLEKLINNIKSSYEEVGHTLKRVSFGLPITHNNCSLESLDWTCSVIELKELKSMEELSSKTEKFSRLLRITVKDS